MSNDQSIANRFADYYAEVSKHSNTAAGTVSSEDILLTRLLSYSGDVNLYNGVVDSNLIQNFIDKLEDKKASDFDKLSAEYLKYCHPVVISCITILFSLFVTCHYVPDNFGIWITVPIPKDESRISAKKTEDFRGITISPVISKVFESVIYFVIGDRYLKS